MNNAAFKAYAGLPRPQEKKSTSTNSSTNTGLLSRGMSKKPEKKQIPEPRQRVANYVAELRQARMDLKNG